MTALLLLLQLNLFQTGTLSDIDSTADKAAVETAVIEWANLTFKEHSEYKFDYFKAFFTDDYFIQTMRIELYEEKMADLEVKKSNGSYHGTSEEYEATLKKLSTAIEEAKNAITSIDRVSYFQTHFWTNIKTRDGITVYYELDIKLNNNYQVIEALENSSIGKKDVNSKIAYKKKHYPSEGN